MRCIIFLNNYYDKRNKYLFIKDVKYKLKKETDSNYFTIKKTKLSKKNENKLYLIHVL